MNLRQFREITRYPSAIIGLIIIIFLVGLSIYTVIALPYEEAVNKWRGGDRVWQDNPRGVPPTWVNLFRSKKLPESIIFDTATDETIQKQVTPLDENLTDIVYTFQFDYTADEFPQEIILFFTSTFEKKAPYISLLWKTPDGREINIGDFSIERAYTRRISQDDKLAKELGGPPEVMLFADPNSEERIPLKGTYTLEIAGLAFEPESTFNVKSIIYGKVFGLAGTDHLRRDLVLGLLWGTPVALAFGLLAAVITSLLTMFIAATGTWFGGWVDSLIQRITEINMMLPVLPILIMVGVFYSRSLWVILGVVILLGIFSASIKSYRAMFMQEREAGYIQAAKAYGAGDVRIIFRYLVPRIFPVLIPSLVVLIPSYVFLEASLAVLGLGDPIMPTWGKIINDARVNGALLKGQYYWVLEPSFMLMLTGFSFAMLGFALDRIFNPRLRGM